MLYIHVLNTAFSFLSTWYQIDWLKHEKNVSAIHPPPVKIFCLFSLFLSEWCKNQSRF